MSDARHARAAGLIVAAPASGSGKTLVTAAIARALMKRGMRVATAKSGPDYIDPGFHRAATGEPGVNLDTWAMRPETLAALVGALGARAELILCEGAMGLFDGAGAHGAGSAADLASRTGWPVVLVVDVRGQAASAAATLSGFHRHRADVPLAGVIFNRTGGPAHASVLRAAAAAAVPDVAILGAIPRTPELALAERHLGLVPAAEVPALDGLIERAAALVAGAVDLDRCVSLARPARLALPYALAAPLPPLGQRIAVARDDAFAFAYPWVLEGWRTQGAEVQAFSPLAGESPPDGADAIYLPGGYPELHAAALAASPAIRRSLPAAAARGATIYGECGGYMALGRGLIDATGKRYAMAGILPLESSFAERRLHLGYRTARLIAAVPLGGSGARFRGHEFHYATIRDEGAGEPLFEIGDSAGRSLGAVGRRVGAALGSFLHLIDRA